MSGISPARLFNEKSKKIKISFFSMCRGRIGEDRGVEVMDGKVEGNVKKKNINLSLSCGRVLGGKMKYFR